MPLLYSFIFLLLCIIIYQDFKHRSLRWELLPLLLISVWIEGYLTIGIELLAYFGGLNFLFFALQLILLTVYVSIQLKAWTNITKEHLGIGDILFFIPLCFTFTPLNLIVFFIVALLITIIIFFVVHERYKPKNRTIPLAGVLSLYLIIIFLLEKNDILSRWVDWISLYH